MITSSFERGSAPATGWLRQCVAVDPKGLIKTESALSTVDLAEGSIAVALVHQYLEQ